MASVEGVEKDDLPDWTGYDGLLTMGMNKYVHVWHIYRAQDEEEPENLTLKKVARV